ncbi:MAG TPA: DUF1643 domain-containing protein [Polyangia bacterium]|nr:DUF1643 domain-containing protein [Polyangia bacterium]
MSGAYLSPCRTWRYCLTRDVDPMLGEGTVAFVGLNPSTADETQDDPTIRRCIRFARDWGYARLKMVNLYAFRTTHPYVLKAVAESGTDIVGPENDHTLALVFGGSDLIVAAWGVHAETERVAQITDDGRWPLHCLGLTRDGAPRHPLYMRADSKPIPFNECARSAAGLGGVTPESRQT